MALTPARGAPAGVVVSYPQWNDAIGQWFFRSERAGDTVALCVDPGALAKIAEAEPSGLAGAEDAADAFVRAVRDELERHGWNVGAVRNLHRDRYPSFLGLLAAQVLAVFRMREGDDRTDRAYWPRLAELLGQTGTKMPYGLRCEDHERLWRALERWANDEVYQGGRWGRLRLPAPRESGHRYVALPKSQALLRSEDLYRLRPLLAGTFRLWPGEPLDSADVEAMLRPFVGHNEYFRTHARRVLEDPERVDAACEQVSWYVYEEWDGSTAAVEGAPRASPGARSRGCPRAWIEIDGEPARLRGGFLDVRDHTRVPETAIDHIFARLREEPGGGRSYRPLRERYMLFVLDSYSGYRLEQRFAYPGDEIVLFHRVEERDSGISSPAGLRKSALEKIAKAESFELFHAQGDAALGGARRLDGLPSGWGAVRLTLREDLWGRGGLEFPWRDCLRVDGSRLRLVGGLRLDRAIWLKGAGPDLVLEGGGETSARDVRIDGKLHSAQSGRLTSREAPVLSTRGEHVASLSGSRLSVRFRVAPAPARFEVDVASLGWVREGADWPHLADPPGAGTDGRDWIRGVQLEGNWKPVVQSQAPNEPEVRIASQLAATARRGGRCVVDHRVFESAMRHPNPLIRALASAAARGTTRRTEK